jgi:ubiquinone biosynthesis protein
MEVQPQLVMLQKTLLAIEGLGRELDPELDLWVTAKPYLQRWMSEQLGWRALVHHIRAEAPNWSALLPQIPRLVHRFLNDEKDDNGLPQYLQQLMAENRRQTILLSIIAAALTATSCLLLVYLVV